MPLLPPPISPLHWTTLITTADYAEGVICLGKSLQMVKSKAPLLCYVTSTEVIDAITARHPTANVFLELIDPTLYDDVFNADLQRDHSNFIDAPRRFLFKLGKPFVFLDADMIAIRNFDELLDKLHYDESSSSSSSSSLSSSSSSSDDSTRIWGVPNYRNKKKNYGDNSGNFNAGVMIVPRPLLSDYTTAITMLNAGYNDTEEKLFNDIFRNRWNQLPIIYNCQKRAFKFAPKVWNAVHEEGIKIVHYVGGKPWQSDEEIGRLDWEAKTLEGMDAMKPYNSLFDVWRTIRNCTKEEEAIICDKGLWTLLPLAQE